MTRDLRLVALAALTGFSTGAFTVSSIAWRYGDVIGPRVPAAHAQVPAALEQSRGPDFDLVRPVRVNDETGTARNDTTAPPIDLMPEAELRERGLTYPVQGARAEDLRDTFHEPRGRDRLHHAVDILAPRHTPVLAVEDGVIARLFTSRAGGLTVYQFDPTGRYVYFYAHLERYAQDLRDGDPVKAGQVIGYVGTSGNAPDDTPHLHFAITLLSDQKRWWEGTPINPYLVLK